VKIFPQLKGVPVEYRWGGRVALTRDFLPHLHEPNQGSSLISAAWVAASDSRLRWGRRWPITWRRAWRLFRRGRRMGATELVRAAGRRAGL
jgi:hypothetical protein